MIDGVIDFGTEPVDHVVDLHSNQVVGFVLRAGDVHLQDILAIETGHIGIANLQGQLELSGRTVFVECVNQLSLTIDLQ